MRIQSRFNYRCTLCFDIFAKVLGLQGGPEFFTTRKCVRKGLSVLEKYKAQSDEVPGLSSVTFNKSDYLDCFRVK